MPGSDRPKGGGKLASKSPDAVPNRSRPAVAKPQPPAANNRRKGRPSSGEETIGRQKLVDAARQLLVTVTPAKLTSAQVAKAAGADRGLIRYYFGSMPNLLAEVANQLSHGLVTTLAEASKGRDGAVVRLRRRIQEFVRYELANPALNPLYAEQILSGKAPAARQTLVSVAAEGHASLLRIIEDGRRSGELRDDFDARLLDIAIIGLCEFIVVGRPILDAWINKGEKPADLIAKYGDFVAELVIRGIATGDGQQ